MLRLERSKRVPPIARLFKKENTFRDIAADSRTHHRALVIAWARLLE
jgi:hypothetical protein